MTESSSAGAKKEQAATHTKVADPADADLLLVQQQLQAAKQEMQAFAYSVSHDLRAPIRAIEGFSKILLEDFGDKMEAEARRFLQHIISNTQVLSSQIEDLLRYYRIAKVPPQKLPVDTSALLERVVQDETTKTPRPGLEVKTGTLPSLFADPELMRQAFSELVANAIKFSKNSSPAQLSIGGKKEKTEDVVWIKDNGVGFDPKYAAKLFQVFQKLHPTNEYPGNGIGLALARRVAEMHGGRVWAESEPAKGATFFVALPRA